MKLFIGVLFATLALNGVLSLPARSEDAEVIGGPRRVFIKADNNGSDGDDDDFTNFKGVIDTGSGYPFLQPNPSVIRVGFFDSFDDLFRRFTARLFPTRLFGSINSDEDNSSEFGFPTIDSKKTNSTSTVKVVDGHKVEVNETVYGDENSVFKVRVVNIRPLEEGETVEEVEIKNNNPVTQGPYTNKSINNNESTESDEKREPLEKKPLDNEIQGNIDDPEKNIVDNKAIATIYDSIMLPTTDDINAAFVTDNGLEYKKEEYKVAAEEELNAKGNRNNEFDTNMSADVEDTDNVDNGENPEVEQIIEHNENTEEEINDNLNESTSPSISLSATNADANAVKKQEYNNEDYDNGNNAHAAETGINFANLNLAAIGNKEREDESSSDEEDGEDIAVEMHPTFNDEWGSLNEPTNEYNYISNSIGEEEEGDDDEIYHGKPIDLSHDTDVNNTPNLPINPDAIFIDVYGQQYPPNYMPQFEKLSLDNNPPKK